MLGFLYLIFAGIIGQYLFTKIVPDLAKICKTSSLTNIPGKSIKLPTWMISLPGAFLFGTLVVAWFTYLVTWLIAYFLPQLTKPLLYGDLVTFLLLIVLVAVLAIRKKSGWGDWVQKFKTLDFGEFFAQHKVELFYILIVTVVWSILMVRSFNFSNGNMNVGFSVSSDFGSTLAILRSFSFGSNFPTEFPHFAGVATGGNDIRYHFMFQFLAGNLEFLGMRIDWAFNLPSILAMVSFLMLLYALTVMIIGKRWSAFIVFLLFFLRSSFAFFTYLMKLITQGVNSIPMIATKIMQNTGYIGNTANEDWGFWLSRVYVNKRHFAFALGIGVLVIILFLPLFKKMIYALHKLRTSDLPKKLAGKVVPSSQAAPSSEAEAAPSTEASPSPTERGFVRLWLQEFLFKEDAWRADNTGRALLIGLMLGLISFWNGAVVITVLPILFFMAIFSKHRISYIYTAAVTVLLTYIQSVFFYGDGTATNQISIFIGFLAARKDLVGIILYYMELLGLLPLLILVVFVIAPKGIRWLTLAFLAPLILATTMKFSMEAAANHVIIIFAVLLLDISITYLLFRLLQKERLAESLGVLILGGIYFVVSAQCLNFGPLVIPTFITVVILGLVIFLLGKRYLNGGLPRFTSVYTVVLLIGFLVATGVVDTITLANEDRGQVGFPMNDPELLWIVKNTAPNDLFLLLPGTYQHTVFLAGRKVFVGGAYITWSSGYDYDGRVQTVRQIYESQNSEELKALLYQNKIKYVLIDDDTRNSPDFKINEALFQNTFPCVYEEPARRIAIYRVQ